MAVRRGIPGTRSPYTTLCATSMDTIRGSTPPESPGAAGQTGTVDVPGGVFPRVCRWVREPLSRTRRYPLTTPATPLTRADRARMDALCYHHGQPKARYSVLPRLFRIARPSESRANAARPGGWSPPCTSAGGVDSGHRVLPAWTRSPRLGAAEQSPRSWVTTCYQRGHGCRHLNHPASPARTTRSANDHRPIRPLLVLPAWTAIPAGGGLSVLAGQKGARGRNVLPAWTDSGGIGASSMDGLCQQRGRFVPAAWTIPRPRSWHNDRLYPSSLERMNQHSEPGAAQITRSGIPRW
jgi:hypothetical protein